MDRTSSSTVPSPQRPCVLDERRSPICHRATTVQTNASALRNDRLDFAASALVAFADTPESKSLVLVLRDTRSQPIALRNRGRSRGGEGDREVGLVEFLLASAVDHRSCP